MNTLVKWFWTCKTFLRIIPIRKRAGCPAGHRFHERPWLYEINLLKFHPLGETKWIQLGKSYPHSGRKSVDQEQMERIQQLYLRNNIACYLGDNTPF